MPSARAYVHRQTHTHTDISSQQIFHFLLRFFSVSIAAQALYKGLNITLPFYVIVSFIITIEFLKFYSIEDKDFLDKSIKTTTHNVKL